MKLAIVGGRDFDDWKRFCETIDAYFCDKTVIGEFIPRFEAVVSGGANGADSLARMWVQERNKGLAADREKTKLVEIFPDWGLLGKSAGIIRNEQIISLSDRVLAFWDSKSPGTKNSLSHAKRMKKDTLIIYY